MQIEELIDHEEKLGLEAVFKSLQIDTSFWKELHTAPSDIRAELLDFTENIEMLSWMMSGPEIRGYAKDKERDSKGRIKVDIVKPHILEDMDYFRQPAIHFQQYGNYTTLYPNPHPKSAYRQHWDEEMRRCKEGYIRESDGEWIPGYYYWYLNYWPIMVSKVNKGEETRGERVLDFPDVWDSDYMFFHYVEQGEKNSKYGACIKTRGRGYSFKASSMLGRNFYLFKKSKGFAFASETEYLTKDGILSKTWDGFEFIDEHTPWRKLRQKVDRQDRKRASYIDGEGKEKGYRSEVNEVTTKGNPEKGRGKRGKLLIHEEAGIYPGLLQTWNIARPSIEDGPVTFGYQVSFGTGGTVGAKFEGLEELFYNGGGYRVLTLKNVWDKIKGEGTCGFYVPEYMNRKTCYDENGNSNVVKAMLQILAERKLIRENASKENALTQEKAERSITPQEAVMRIEGSLFPVDDLKVHLEEITPILPQFVSEHYVGTLVAKGGTDNYEFFPKADAKVIREFPLKDNINKEGAIEIFEMPVKNGAGEIPKYRYFGGIDSYDDDSSTTNSLGSILIADILTDRIVAEFTGRPKTAAQFYEICLRLLKFYNGVANYEAHPYSQIVKLPNGTSKLWENIQIGDELFAPNNKTVKVIDIPVDEYMPIYKITLNDGREVMCSEDHIWSVYKLNEHPHELKDYSTKEIINIGTQNKHKQNNFFIPNGGNIEYPKIEVPIDPYIMGLIIAEGCIRGSHCTKNQVQVSSSSEDMDFYKTIIPYKIKYSGTKGSNWNFVIENCKSIFKKIGLLNSRSETKFIPDNYLYNSYENRLELLKGLMDGDGHATKNGSPVYVTSSKKLADNVSSLCRSLGFNCKIKQNKTSKLDSYKVTIFTDTIIFKLPRKVIKQHKHDDTLKGSKASSYINKIAIKSIEFSHYEMGKCVTVDSDDGRYLIGDYIVTHNCDKKGLYTYFYHNHALNYLCDTPQTLKDMDLVKAVNLYGNKKKGTNSNTRVNAFGRRQQAEWMLRPAYNQPDKLNLHTIRSIGYLKEAIGWNEDGNFDRISAGGMLMILRDEYLKYKLQIQEEQMGAKTKTLAQDPFFNNNFNSRGERNKVSSPVMHVLREKHMNNLKDVN